MDLIRINEVADNFGISSRTLRYYEEMGLLWSNHPDNKSQRYYDTDALERLKQIIILRKLQIPIKDMVVIFKSENMAALIQAFVDKLESLDTEISALSELRHLVAEFLQQMLMSGIKKISGITLLYEETEKRLATVERNETVTFEKLSAISREALRLHDVRIIRLPPMRVLTSRLKTGQVEHIEDKMQSLFFKYGFTPNPGLGDGGYWGDDMKLCDGCHTGGLDKSFNCDSLKCAAENNVDRCQNFHKNPCDKAHHLYHGLKPEIHTNIIAADDVTWGILPYVYEQYEN